MLGVVLITLTSSCKSDSDEPEVTCYISVSPNDTVEVQSLPAPDTLIEITEVNKIDM